MKLFSRLSKRRIALMVAVTGLIAVTSVSVLAAPPKSSVLRVTLLDVPHTGLCCSSWDESVSVIEPDRLVPIVVTWSTDYQATAPFYAGLRVNGGPCTFDGPANLPAFVPDDGTSYTSETFQWVIMPGDFKLTKGPNVITLCGGAAKSETDTITLGFNTLTAHLQH